MSKEADLGMRRLQHAVAQRFFHHRCTKRKLNANAVQALRVMEMSKSRQPNANENDGRLKYCENKQNSAIRPLESPASTTEMNEVRQQHPEAVCKGQFPRRLRKY
jgi:hypothetical protein